MELMHGGVFPVIRQLLNDCESWPTISARNEEVVMTRIIRVSEFREALAAYGDVWRNNRACLLFFI